MGLSSTQLEIPNVRCSVRQADFPDEKSYINLVATAKYNNRWNWQAESRSSAPRHKVIKLERNIEGITVNELKQLNTKAAKVLAMKIALVGGGR